MREGEPNRNERGHKKAKNHQKDDGKERYSYSSRRVRGLSRKLSGPAGKTKSSRETSLRGVT